jgi:hypothetical protein
MVCSRGAAKPLPASSKAQMKRDTRGMVGIIRLQAKKLMKWQYIQPDYRML